MLRRLRHPNIVSFQAICLSGAVLRWSGVGLRPRCVWKHTCLPLARLAVVRMEGLLPLILALPAEHRGILLMEFCPKASSCWFQTAPVVAACHASAPWQSGARRRTANGPAAG